MFLNLDLYRFTTCFDMYMAGGEMQDDALKKDVARQFRKHRVSNWLSACRHCSSVAT